MKRSTSRRLAMQAVFQLDLDPSELEKGLKVISQDDYCPAVTREYAEKLFRGLHDHLEKIDALLKKHLINWEFNRLAKVDKAILRLAGYELLFEKDLSANIIIDEALELAKKFGDKDSPTFINGVLDAVYKEIQASKSLDNFDGLVS